jgi:Ser/Thr protein kinase RdoA (MazF antagonist)
VTDVAVIGRLLDEYHERSVPPASIEVVAGSVHEARISYKLTLADGSAQVVRAFRADGAVPVEMRGPFTETMLDWLTGRARTLAVLAAARYEAPRPVLTRTDELIAVAGPWLAWATMYVPGPVLTPSLRQLGALGESLGRLHHVVADGRGASLAPRHPAVAVPMTLSRLDAVSDKVPGEWAAICQTFRQTVLSVSSAAGSVPETMVHGDAWARNAVASPAAGHATLIDWELSGLGLAVVDLGNCLMECHLNSAASDLDPEAWLIAPDEDRIAATASGYASARALSAAELALLPDAVRFTTAVIGAIHVELALAQGVSGPTMDARLARLENRLAIADEVAALAVPYLINSR